MARALNQLTAVEVKTNAAGKYSDGGGPWVLRVTVHGRRREMGLGSASEISLKDARSTAAKWRNLAAQEVGPIKQREKDRRSARRNLHSLADIAKDAFESRKAEPKGNGEARRGAGWLPVPQRPQRRDFRCHHVAVDGTARHDRTPPRFPFQPARLAGRGDRYPPRNRGNLPRAFVGGTVERAYRRTDYLDQRRVVMARWVGQVTGHGGQVLQMVKACPPNPGRRLLPPMAAPRAGPLATPSQNGLQRWAGKCRCCLPRLGTTGMMF